jgi:glucose 1-dehydrogenase
VKELDLGGRVALITGASRGIGRGCAIEMAKLGADVVVNYRSHPSDAEDVVSQVRALGRRAVAVGADVSTREGVDRLIGESLAAFGQIDILLNNAYRSIRKPLLTLTDDEVAATWDTTLWSVFRCSQEVARHMVERGHGGVILAISSTFAFIPWPGSLPYNVAKAGVEQMVLTMATELAPYHIRVAAIEPGWTDTPGERQWSTEEQLREGAELMPLGRLGRPADLGRLCAFLASEAASFATGAVWRLDGGQWLPGAIKTIDHMR